MRTGRARRRRDQVAELLGLKLPGRLKVSAAGAVPAASGLPPQLGLVNIFFKRWH